MDQKETKLYDDVIKAYQKMETDYRDLTQAYNALTNYLINKKEIKDLSISNDSNKEYLKDKIERRKQRRVLGLPDD